MKEIKKYLESRIGEYSFYFEDINSGFSYSMNEKTRMPAASCVKIPIAIALLKESECGNLDLSKTYHINLEDMVGGDGIIKELQAKEYSLKELLVLMLLLSDNSATNKIIDVLGMNLINKHIEKMGLKDTCLRRKMMDFKQREKGIENITNSFDFAMSFKILYNASYISVDNSEYLLSVLRKQKIRDKIPFYIPQREWKNIANKTGTLNGIENDGALMTIEKGNFVFTIMSKSLPNNVYGIVTLSRCGKMIWDIIERSWR